MTDPFAVLNAALADHYIVDRELGRGGMALVYLARDVRHERFVALKTLRPEIAMALGRERFLREIKLAARLQHPNILPVYDSGDAAGTLFYVMPYVEGESLRDRLEREPQLPLDDALLIAREVAEALTYAHSHDVVHRDIKPENIMLSGGHAIVTDFGIARAVSAAGGDKLTETGLAIGTPAYMPPEQAAGTGKVDRRSDIYSLACVLYETLAGQPPFTGPTAQAIMARHSLDSVPRLKIVRDAIPDDLEAVIEHALEKVPADRYQSAEQFARDLNTASTGAVSRVTAARVRPRKLPWRRAVPLVVGATVLAAIAWIVIGRRGSAGSADGGLHRNRVAVLYFRDESRDSSLGYLADGLTEALIDQLGAIRAVDVVSRGGVAPFRGREAPRDSVARVLDAANLVEGEVENLGSRVRVTVRLVDGGSGADLRRQSFQLSSGAQLAIRDSVAKQAAVFLRERIGDEIRLREERAATRSVDAWTLVQRAERARKDGEAALISVPPDSSFSGFDQADSLLGAAERADPQWIEPILQRGQLALRRARLLQRTLAVAARWLTVGTGHASRVLNRDPNHPAGLQLRGTLRYVRWILNLDSDPDRRAALLDSAQADLESAVRGDPRLASAQATLSHLLYARKDVVSAVLAARAAYEADAYLRDAEVILDRLFYGSYDLAQFSEAQRWCAEGVRRFPKSYRFVDCQLWMLTTPSADLDIDRAWRLAAQADGLTPAPRLPYWSRMRQIVVASVIGRAGRRDSAERVLERARTDDPQIDPSQELVGYEALARALMGDEDTAIAILKRYVATHPEHSFRRNGMVHWWWRGLERRPDFQAVLSATH
ncbi:MAG TPA: serine/threonine-protein kinase [Gemmatimonadales bacterium]|nr:serine/threonine-protein kinase [Gemmatimonadales bacterium]